ncbi:MAG TPA: 23S rRNA (adenine(2503)-C(2))-methyltransferase RlmN [Tenuifilaceae bacterium]|nr:23S rRNA (adenine(2503)-C(2))-methyltransferase RlmN [Tenuifilaceae bacterium]HRX68673.1 23S rRNA (adenine(2503)-C(2))-methyltransferase RlmN [Tenuifilaceae bacterium]
MNRESILGCLPQCIERYGFTSVVAEKVCTWVYRKRVTSFDLMMDIPKPVRNDLCSKFSISLPSPVEAAESVDGSVKYLFKTDLGNPFEAVFMPTGGRGTLCISTQSGCRMACSFCYTGSMGFRQNLSAGEIVGQVLGVPRASRVNRIVIMGMGEPLDNFNETLKALDILTASWGVAFGASNITLSTIGVLPELQSLIEMRKCNIAVSLHCPFGKGRAKLMPSEILHPILNTIELLRKYPVKKPLRLSFEYLVIPGVNDSQKDAVGVAQLLFGLKSHVNVIPYNSPEVADKENAKAKKFQKLLNKLGVPATFRQPRGFDISAACGMLAAKSEGTV